MSSELDDAPDDTVNSGDPYIVTDKMGNRLRWDENNATINGFMHEIGEQGSRPRDPRPPAWLNRGGLTWLSCSASPALPPSSEGGRPRAGHV